MVVIKLRNSNVSAIHAFHQQDPVVQSEVISQGKSCRTYKILFFIYLKKTRRRICLHSFQQKCIVFCVQIEWTYYFSLTYGIVNFEQLSSGFLLSFLLCFFLCLLIFFFLKETLCNETVLVKIYIESNLKQKMAFLHL